MCDMICNIAALGPLRFVPAPPPFNAANVAAEIRKATAQGNAIGLSADEIERVVIRLSPDRYQEPIREALRRLPL